MDAFLFSRPLFGGMYESLIPPVVVIAGMLVIFKSAQKTIESAILIARTLGINKSAIGFILLSVATSLPELVISVSAALRGGSDLSVGNVFGANIANVSLVLGAAAILGTVAVKRRDLRELSLILLAVSAISLLFVIYQPRRLAGIALLLIFGAYAYWVLTSEKAKAGREKKSNDATKAKWNAARLLKPLAKFSLSIAIILISAQFVVENAVKLSVMMGIAQTVIGATIISIGSTLPELSVSIAAVRKKQEKMAVGNAVGSAIVNLTLVFGSALVINPGISVVSASKLMIFSVLANLALLHIILTKGGIGKREGAFMVAGYFAFILLYAFGN
jgi:cation:H+ antiporter